jgi:hypothetical protein
MTLTADRCKETSTTTGTGDFTLAGAVAQFQSFSSVFPLSTVFMYAIVGQSGTQWEVGYGSLISSTVMSRDEVKSSSNSNNVVNFSAGTKDVFATVTASKIAEIPISTTAEVNFGSTSTGNASLSVAAPWVTATSKILVIPSGVATTDHDPEDYILEGVYGVASSIVVGVGFTLLAGCKNTTFGKYIFNIVGV